jgi:hypothetical protein
MKIQIIALGMTDQSHRKFYNTQDMGLGRALADMGHCVDMYSFIKGDTDEIVEFFICIIFTQNHSGFIHCIPVTLLHRM